MAPPGVLSFYENSNTSPSILLSPFPSFSDCISHMSVHSDHSYFFKNIDDNIKKSSPDIVSTRDCFDSDIPSSDESEVMTPTEDKRVSPGPVSNGRTEVNDKVFNDVTLVSRLEAPVMADTDFLQGLDELDFDFDDCEPSRGISLENFIDATLEDTMDVSTSFNNNSNNNNSDSLHDYVEEDGEDVYKKEFFLKHLRLQRVPSRPTTSRKNRKRKHEESESNFSEPLVSSCFPHPLMESGNPHHQTHTTTTADYQKNTLKHIPSPLQSDTLLPPLSVPSKLCSCASNDWKRTILYSTAKSHDVTSVQTSPSTASASGIHRHQRLSPRCYSDNFSFQDNDVGRLSPSLLLSDKAKDCFEFDLLDKSDMDEDTKDLLQWLDNNEIQTTIAGISTQHSQTSSYSPSRSTSESDCSSPTTNSVMTADDLEDILSPKSHQSSWELDRFQDLEAYVSDVSTPLKGNEENFRNVTSDNVFPKHQLRLSILADISKEFINSAYTEKKEAIKMEILKSCQPNHVSYSTKQSNFSPEYWSDSPHSSSSLSSSPFSSPPHSPSESSQDFVNNTQSKNLDLLDLFSDENAVWCL